MVICGDGYNIEVVEGYDDLGHGWFVEGFIGDMEVDSMWAGVHIPTFTQADDLVLECLRDNL